MIRNSLVFTLRNNFGSGFCKLWVRPVTSLAPATAYYIKDGGSPVLLAVDYWTFREIKHPLTNAGETVYFGVKLEYVEQSTVFCLDLVKSTGKIATISRYETGAPISLEVVDPSYHLELLSPDQYPSNLPELASPICFILGIRHPQITKQLNFFYRPDQYEIVGMDNIFAISDAFITNVDSNGKFVKSQTQRIYQSNLLNSLTYEDLYQKNFTEIGFPSSEFSSGDGLVGGSQHTHLLIYAYIDFMDTDFLTQAYSISLNIHDGYLGDIYVNNSAEFSCSNYDMVRSSLHVKTSQGWSLHSTSDIPSTLPIFDTNEEIPHLASANMILSLGLQKSPNYPYEPLPLRDLKLSFDSYNDQTSSEDIQLRIL